MMAVDMGIVPALNLGNPGTAPGAGCTLPGRSSGMVAAKAADESSNSSPDSFRSFMDKAGKPASRADSGAAASGGKALPGNKDEANTVSEDPPLDPACGPAENPQGNNTACGALAQLIQSLVLSSARLPEQAELPSSETRPEADAGEDGQELLRFIDLLRQLQTPRGNSANASSDPLVKLQGPLSRGSVATDAGEDGAVIVQFLNQLRANRGERPGESAELLSRLRDLLAHVTAEGEGRNLSALPGRIYQQLIQAREAVAGMPLGRLAQLPITGQGDSTGVPAVPQPSVQSERVQTGDAPLAGVGHPDLPDLLRAALRQGKTEASKLPQAGCGATDATDPKRDSAPVSGREAAGVQDMLRSEESLRPPVLDANASMTVAVEDGGDDGVSSAALRDMRATPAPEGSVNKPAEALATARFRETDGAASKGDVVSQIVQRAAVHLKSDQGEARIELKPEYMGHVRMQIVTDSQQVTVRIVTELSMVRDLIEQNLQQLKSDLQQQGLQVERVEVSVADDPRRDAGRQNRAGGRRNGREASAQGLSAAGSVEESVQSPSVLWNSSGRATINMFV